MPARVGESNAVHKFAGTHPIQRRYVGGDITFQNANPPQITAFSVDPNMIDLDSRPSGTLTFRLAVMGSGSSGPPVARASDITFSEFQSVQNFYEYSLSGITYSPTARPGSGSSSISNEDLKVLYFDGQTGRFFYEMYISNSLILSKIFLNIEVDGTSYPISFLSRDEGNNVTLLRALNIPTSGRVSDSDLTKAINFELVDNEQVTLGMQGNPRYFIYNINKGNITYQIYFYPFSQNNGGHIEPANSWSMNIGTSTKTPTHIIVNGRAYALTLNPQTRNRGYYTQTISNTNFRPSSSKLDWGINIRFSDGTYVNNTRSHLFQAPSITPQDTYAQIVKLPEGTDVGITHLGANGAGIDASLPNIPQPNQTTTYRLIARNDTGASHRDAQVVVTQNPVLANLQALGAGTGPGAPGGANIQISGRVTGYPRPSITINQNFNNGQALSDRHFSPVAGQVNTWDFSLSWFYGTSGRRAFVVTAQNSSGQVTGNVVFNG